MTSNKTAAALPDIPVTLIIIVQEFLKLLEQYVRFKEHLPSTMQQFQQSEEALFKCLSDFGYQIFTCSNWWWCQQFPDTTTTTTTSTTTSTSTFTTTPRRAAATNYESIIGYFMTLMMPRPPCTATAAGGSTASKISTTTNSYSFKVIEEVRHLIAHLLHWSRVFATIKMYDHITTKQLDTANEYHQKLYRLQELER
ncbi:MAG: hypothetical protein K2Y05_01775 [Hyphomicrobiaceae bacterium]|nr:hypothetical protein [Hyphomicrobiaceae bacterium]